MQARETFIRTDLPGLIECRAAYSYRQEHWLRKLIKRQKRTHDYEVRLDNSLSLANMLYRVWQQAAWRAHLIVPVPSSPERMAERGYNPIDYLALELSRLVGLPLHVTALQKVKETEPQKRLDRASRLASLESAFQASSAVKMRTCVLVDDVLTTGATLSACARALTDAGALGVYGLTVAMTIGHWRR